MADLGPGTMPRGKYPESPAPAGSHALISRTPTPGGMLHANLGLPRPPPRNFQPPLPQQALKTNSNSAPIKPVSFPSSERVKESPKTKTPRAVTLWRHACLTTPVVKRWLLQQLPVQPQKNPPIPLTPRAAAPAAACVAGRSLACERIPLRHRSNLQRKKQHRHSGIFRVADLGPGTMPRGKYPESPAQAGSHALISRTPTPGGMLHANLGLPRPPPRNFQPPLPQQALKTNSNSAPIKPVSFPSSERVKESPKPKTSSCCRSRGGMRGWPLPSA